MERLLKYFRVQQSQRQVMWMPLRFVENQLVQSKDQGKDYWLSRTCTCLARSECVIFRGFCRRHATPMTNFVYCQRLFAVFSIFSSLFSLQSAAVYSLRSWVFWPVSSSTSCLQLAPIAAQQRKPIKWRFVCVANCICLPSQLNVRLSACLSAPWLIHSPLSLSVCLVKLRLHILLAYR